MSLRTYAAAFAALALVGCISAEQRELNRQRDAQAQQELAARYRAALEDRCKSYGFHPGSDAFANCIAEEHRGAVAEVRGNACNRARMSMRDWCGRSRNAMTAYQCESARQAVAARC